MKFNSIFGYYIEISKANLHLAPAEYERKQTLVNAERFTTPELKEYESKILDAQEKIVEIERRLFRGTAIGDCRGGAAHPADRAGIGRGGRTGALWPTSRHCAITAGRGLMSLPTLKSSADGIR